MAAAAPATTATAAPPKTTRRALCLLLAWAAPALAATAGGSCASGPPSSVGSCAAADFSTADAYAELCSKLRELDALEGVSGLLTWDELVMMPDGAVGSRGAQKAALAGVLYDKRTDPRIGELLGQLKGATLTPVQAAVVREAQRAYTRTIAIPKELAQRMAKLETDGYQAWVAARKDSDFSKFAPFLQQWLDANLEKAAAIDPSKPVYDVLLDDYEKGMTSARLDAIFAEVRQGLVPLLAELQAKGTPPSDAPLKGKFDVKQQAALCEEVALAMGFDKNNGRLDVSVHPFTGGAHPTDVRMTTRFKEGDLSEGLTGAIHETGHALYEQGRNLGPEWEGLPINQAMSMGIHESQSLLWERMVGLGEPFARWLLPKIRAAFPDFPEHTPRELYEASNVVKSPSLIRVEADEVTYPLHIILRYELERGLLEGTIKVSDVPAVWNQKMSAYLGVTPADDAQGCLQDVHWSSGSFGYFPTYSLGAMYACQLFQHAKQQLPGLEDKLAAGDFKPLREWLNAQLHAKGSLYASGDELMQAITGSQLQPQVFLGYLRSKYAPLYKLPASS